MKNIDKTPQELRKEEVERKANRSGNEAYLVSRKQKLINIIILIVSGAMYATIFAPFNFAGYAWIALLPLYFVVCNMQNKWQAFRAGYIWGFTWNVFSFAWIREIMIGMPLIISLILPILLSLVLAFYYAIFAMFIPIFKRNILIPFKIQMLGYAEIKKYKNQSYLKEIALVASLASLWCVLEWIRSWFLSGLPWNFISVSQWRNIPLIQFVKFTGGYGISFIIVFANIAIAISAMNWRDGFLYGKYRKPISLIVTFVMIALMILAGNVDCSEIKTKTINVGVIQGNILQCRGATEDERQNALDTYISLSEMALTVKPDVIIWPETAVPFPYLYNHPFAQQYRNRVSQLIYENKVPFLIGTIDYRYPPFAKTAEDVQTYNSAFFIDKNANIADKFDKIHRVPFGEYIPFRNLLPEFIIKAIDMGRDLTPGKKYDPIEIKPGIKAGISICFEDVFPYITRKEFQKGANLLTVISNDAWYPTSSESEQHLANTVFRTIETGLPLVRCGNDSNSCLVSSNGQILDTARIKNYIYPANKKGKGFAIFKVDVPINPKATFYTKYGNIFIILCFIISGYGFIISFFNLLEKRKSLAPTLIK